MPLRLRKALIALVTFIGGLYFFLIYFLPLPDKIAGHELQPIHEQITLGVMIVGNMAIGLGILNLLTVHGTILFKGGRRRAFSAALLVGMCLTFLVEIGDFIGSERANNSWKTVQALSIYAARAKQPVETSTDSAASQSKIQSTIKKAIDDLLQAAHSNGNYLSLNGLTDPLPRVAGQTFETQLLTLQKELQETNTPTLTDELIRELQQLVPNAQAIATWNYENTRWKQSASLIKNGFFVPLGTSMFALLAFYIASAAYRSFRVRSLEAVLMMSAAILVILGQIPQGQLYISDSLPELRKWLLDNVSTPAFRAITFAAMIAGLAMAVRMWLSLERSSIDEESAGK